MPECRRCRRVQATCELRRNGIGGYVCKDNGPGSRCWTIVRNLRASRRLHGRTQQAGT